MEATPAKRRTLNEPSAALGFLVAILVLVGIVLRLVYPEQMRQFERIINPYWPSIIGLMLPLLLLLAVWRNWFAQLGDIINPNSAAEVRRYWFRLGTVHFTLNWIINLLVALAVWGFLLYVIV